MEIKSLLREGCAIWSDRYTLDKIVHCMGKVFGDICKNARNQKPGDYNEGELKKELGNIIFSTIRWCDDLGFDPEECIILAKKCQKIFPKK